MSSSYRESANRRRDIRQAKPLDAATKGAAKKDTKRWCRGKVGVEHKPVCVPYRTDKPEPNADRWSSHKWRILQCETCGRKLDYWYPFGADRHDKPAWVDK